MRLLHHFLLTMFTIYPIVCKSQDGDIDTKMQKLAVQLSERIRATGKNRVGVADFNDLQSNVPELGKFLAENLQGELVNNQLRIINRQRIEQLLIENKLTAQKLLDPDNALILGKAAGMEVIVTGTITPIDERMLAINVLALDVQGAVAIASAKTSIMRTPAINILLRTVVGRTSNSGEPGLSPSGGKDYEEDIPRSRCANGDAMSGAICFNNIHNEPLLLFKVTTPNYSNGDKTNVLIASGEEGCWALVPTDLSGFCERSFHFRTTSGIIKEGFITLSVYGCKRRHITLRPSSFNLEKVKLAR